MRVRACVCACDTRVCVYVREFGQLRLKEANALQQQWSLSKIEYIWKQDEQEKGQRSFLFYRLKEHIWKGVIGKAKWAILRVQK